MCYFQIVAVTKAVFLLLRGIHTRALVLQAMLMILTLKNVKVGTFTLAARGSTLNVRI